MMKMKVVLDKWNAYFTIHHHHVNYIYILCIFVLRYFEETNPQEKALFSFKSLNQGCVFPAPNKMHDLSSTHRN